MEQYANLKRCSKCKEYKDKTSFGKKKKSPDGLDYWCKACNSLYATKKYKENAEEIKSNRRVYYQENKEQELDYAREYRETHREETREYARKRRQEYPEEVKVINRASYKRHAEKWRERAKTYREENPEKVADSKRRCYIKHRDKNLEYAKKYREENPEYQRIYRSTRVGYWRKWQESHPDQRRACLHNYRVRKLNAVGTYTEEDIKYVREAQKGCCFYCGVLLDAINYHHDHMTPLSRGGSNWPNNIALSCPSCNLSKHDKTSEEFFAYLESKKK